MGRICLGQASHGNEARRCESAGEEERFLARSYEYFILLASVFLVKK